MDKFAVALGLASTALGFATADIVAARRPQVATISTMIIATVDMTPMPYALPIESADANGALAADYSWQRWPSVTDF